MHRNLSSAILALCLLFITGCSDDPNAIGIGLIPSKDAIKINSVKITAASGATDTARIQGTSTRLLLGKYGHLEARTLLQFVGIPADKPSAVVDSAILKLILNYRFKDSTGIFGIAVHRLLRPWSSATTTWDTLESGTLYDADSTATTILTTVHAQDSILAVNITPVVASWFKNLDTTAFGVILIPAPTVNPNFVLGFSNYTNGFGDFRPSLKISYHDSTTDTTTLTLAPSEQLFLANRDLPVPSDTIYVQAGIAYRGRLHFSLPDSLKGASITSATMVLYLDSSASLRNSYTANSIEARLALDSTSLPRLSSLLVHGLPDQNDGSMFAFDMKNFVQQWLTGTSNYGLVLRALNEYVSVDGFVFYGVKSIAAHRPALKVTYTKFPQKVRRTKP